MNAMMSMRRAGLDRRELLRTAGGAAIGGMAALMVNPPAFAQNAAGSRPSSAAERATMRRSARAFKACSTLA